MTQEEIEKIVNNISASFAMEDMQLTVQDRDIACKILKGELDGETYLKEYIEQNKNKNEGEGKEN